MDLIERYILRITAGAFVACLLSLTAVIWITQALKELDLLTGKGQTIIVFLLVTLLSLPALITVIAPVALFIATIYALNKLNSDSELIVMSAAGMSPLRLLRPFLMMTAAVALLVGYLTIYMMPNSFRDLRDLVTKIRADFVANIVKEGQFTSLDTGITFHYRERSGGALMGIFLQDRREKDKTAVYIAERGQTVEVEGQSYLVLEKGTVQRQQPNSRDASIVSFERYAIDLSAFGQDGGEVVYKPRERTTTALIFPDTKEFYYQFQSGRFRAELHDRLSSPLYPVALMLIAFAALGEARTTRQGRGTAMAFAVMAVIGLRIAGFAASSAVVRTPWALLAVYGVPIGASIFSALIIFQGARVKAASARLNRKLVMLMAPLRLRTPRPGSA
jgi:lipopolysaccharide export system permease protein